ncbi:hypothetical protein [Curtobacterium sp. MCSS17_005]|uniref:hypothetical protein n=1 Tax=Curtobacterium sp. MCSS17_005 TaxID=2175641 RepID=UPI0024DF4CB1|nr:hypothetical protein [Curtobacterium sp. MCSS17_005]WIB34425.1 hypothetical protein DEJ20_08145 [Curtobacterium sp. MCSS17_005]
MGTKVDLAEAAKVLRDAGCTPLEPYPGNATPWRCVHEPCGREIAPTYANIRRRGSACKHCAADARGAKRRAGLADAAVAEMRAAGFEPLEPYPGTAKPWRCRHELCGHERTPTLNTVRMNGTACRDCSARAAGRAVWTAAGAEAEFRVRGLDPLEPWPGSSTKPWRARHVSCGRIVAPRLGNVVAGQGPCRECGLEASHAVKRHDHDEAAKLFRAAGLEPLEPYRGVDIPWRSRHLRCGDETAPTYTNVKAGSRGCARCFRTDLAASLRMPEAEARAIMLAKSLEPVEPYPGSGRPWASRHSCGRVVTPTMSNVAQGKGICRYCFSDFPYDGPAVLYLVVDRNAVKVGCASPNLRRLGDHRRFGWKLAWTVDVGTGDEAYNLEQALLTWWREDLGIAPAYLPHELPQTGYSETAPWAEMSPARVLAKLREIADELRVELVSVSETEFAVDRPETAADAIGARARAARRGREKNDQDEALAASRPAPVGHDIVVP